MKIERLALALVVIFGFFISMYPQLRFEVPLSWGDWSYLRISKGFPETYLHDEKVLFGERHTDSPLFYGTFKIIFSLVAVFGVTPISVAKFSSPIIFAITVLTYYVFCKKYFGKKIAIFSCLFLTTIPLALDQGMIFNPSLLALPFMFLGLYYFESYTSIFFGIALILLHLPSALFYFLVLIGHCFAKKEKKFLKIIFLSIILSSPYLIYYLKNFTFDFHIYTPNIFSRFGYVQIFLGVFGFLFLHEKLKSMLILAIPSLILFLFSPHLFAFMLPIPISFLLTNFKIEKKVMIATILGIFYLSLIPAQNYVFKTKPAVDEYQDLVFLKECCVENLVIGGWFSSPLLSSISSMISFRNPANKKTEELEKEFFMGNSDILLDYDVRYVYYGNHEKFEYPNRNFELDKIHHGKAEIYDNYPEILYVLITVDAEPDLPPVLNTFKGIEEGIPKILELLKEYNAKATFLVTGEVAELYPEIFFEISKNHEVGMHGMYHERLTNLKYREKKIMLEKATFILKNLVGDVYSFRAPGNYEDSEVFEIVKSLGYKIDASDTKDSYPYFEEGLLKIPISKFPQSFYLSNLWREEPIKSCKYVLKVQKNKVFKIVVVGVHSWEFVEIHAEGWERYTVVTGDFTSNTMRELLNYLKKKGARFVTAKELLEILKKCCPLH